MRIIAVYNIKGGVGKTAAAVNLSYCCAKDGIRTLIWDLDAQGAASFYFNVKPKVKGGTKKLIKSKELDGYIKETGVENLDILPADFSYRHMDLVLEDAKKSKTRMQKLLDSIKDEYDAVFLDAPPSISLVSENIFQAASHMLVPVIPTTLSLRTYEQIREYFKKESIQHVKLLPFFSMADRRKKMHKEIMQNPGIDMVMDNVIPYSSIVEKMGLYCAPVKSFAPHSIAARAYSDLWEETKERCDFLHLSTLPKIFGTRS